MEKLIKNKPVYSIVLNTHIPQSDRPWAYEALFHCYLPLFKEIKNLPVVMGFSPQLILEFTSKNFKSKTIKWYNETVKKINTIDDKSLRKYYITYYTEYLNLLEEIDFDLKKLWNNNNWEILAYPSTHSVLPLLSEKLIKFFLEEGEKILKDFFDVTDFSGIWMPEIAFEWGPNNLQYILSEKYEYIFGNWKTVQNLGHYNNLYSDINTGLKVIIRNDGAQQDIWGWKSQIAGYQEYRESFKADINGNKIFSIGEGLYNPELALTRLNESQEVAKSSLQYEEGDYVALMFDTEFFGHHWWEGKYFLPKFLNSIKGNMKTTSDYPGLFDSRQIDLSNSSYSWGSMGYEQSNSNLETWVNGSTHSILQYYREALIKIEQWDKDKLKFFHKELNLLFSSDWLFNISNMQQDIYDFSFDNVHFSKKMVLDSYKKIV